MSARPHPNPETRALQRRQRAERDVSCFKAHILICKGSRRPMGVSGAALRVYRIITIHTMLLRRPAVRECLSSTARRSVCLPLQT